MKKKFSYISVLFCISTAFSLPANTRSKPKKPTESLFNWCISRFAHGFGYGVVFNAFTAPDQSAPAQSNQSASDNNSLAEKVRLRTASDNNSLAEKVRLRTRKNPKNALESFKYLVDIFNRDEQLKKLRKTKPLKEYLQTRQKIYQDFPQQKLLSNHPKLFEKTITVLGEEILKIRQETTEKMTLVLEGLCTMLPYAVDIIVNEDKTFADYKKLIKYITGIGLHITGYISGYKVVSTLKSMLY